ncbi:MAG TPA: transposase family protein [Pilimelia sp.]|nr:transposase family protein [Pilimelia sp.]
MTHIDTPAEGQELVYQVTLPVSTRSLALVTRALRIYRRQVKSRWRKLPDARTALIVLAVLRKDERPADLAAGNGVSHHSVRRWVKQAVTVLARMAPRLDRVLSRAARARHDQPVLLLDGTCIPVHTSRGRVKRRFWCPKHKAYHLRVMTLTDQRGRLLWTSAAAPARLHETTQAKRLGLPARLRRHGLAIICDRYHTRLDDQPATDPTVLVGRRGSRNHRLTTHEKTVNALLARERVANEHAHAHLKNWRVLNRLRRDWREHATTIVRALLVLTQAEVAR